jgi:hypothetical protein
MSLLVSTIVIPAFVAKRAKDATSGARQVQKLFLVFAVLYVAAVLYIVPRLSP